jgi:hypothetical protein
VSLAAGSVTGTMLAPLAIQISTLPAGSSSFNSSADGVYLSSTGCLYLAQQTANKVAKINVVTGVTTLIAPPSGTIGARCGVVYSTTLGKLIVGTNTGFFLMNPTTNATTALVTPTSWGGINLAYDETNDWVYCTDTSWKFNRIHSGGTSQAASTNAFASNGARVLVVGTDCFALDTVSKIHKINPSSWPAEATTALSLGVVLTQDSGLAYNSATSKILVGGTLGNIFVVDPSALTLTSTVNVGGTSNIQNIITTATRIYCFDAAGKIWILDANTYATLNYIWPQSAFSSPGLVYDTDRGVLNAPGASSSSVFRFLA